LSLAKNSDFVNTFFNLWSHQRLSQTSVAAVLKS